MKWIEVSLSTEGARLNALTQFCNERNFDVQFEEVHATEENWRELISEAMKSTQAIRIGPGLRQKILTYFVAMDAETHQLGAADALIFEMGKWWPRSATFKALLPALSMYGEGFHLGSEVLIVGTGSLAKVAVAALFQQGFTQFTIVDADETRAREMMRFLARYRLGAKFHYIPKEGLILLPSNYGVCVNTITKQDVSLLNDIAYFNFLMPKGLLLDFLLEEGVSPLVKEAEAIGLFSLAGPRLYASIDAAWVEMATGKNLNKDELESYYSQKFQPKV